MTHNILVVEDNPLTQKVVRFALERRGYVVVSATDGRSALDALEKTRPDLVLQDLVLPDMDGFDLAEQLRAELMDPRVPILAFSGFVSSLDQRRLSAVGFDGQVVKPIEPSRLTRLIAAHLPEQPAEDVERFGIGRTLVVADDEPLQAKLARIRLERFGFQVIVARDGAEALEAARRKPPDAIVTDVMMPRVDGFRLCMEARRDPALRDLPIVLVTSSYIDDEDRSLADQAGATAYVVRTPDFNEVATALRTALSSPESVAPPSPPDPDALERVHAQRVILQLERQVRMNGGIAQRCATLSAELSILSGISTALTRHGDIEEALDEVLAASFDAGGISTGALYLLDPAGGPSVRTFGALDDAGLTSFFGNGDTLATLLRPREVLALPRGDDGASRAVREAGVASALLVPLVRHDQPLGALLLASRSATLDEPDRIAFTTAVANQIATAVALAHTFAAQKAAQQQLMMADRLASVGMLAAGVAHEINNPLAAVMGNVDLALYDLGEVAAAIGFDRLQSITRELTDALDAADRVRNIVNDLRVFSRTQEEATARVHLHDVIESTLRMAMHQVRHRARLVKDLRSVPAVDANESRLGQVFLNLVVNAAQAIPEGAANENEITVVTWTDPDGNAVVEVRDTGVGIANDVLPRLFTPFFTTKREGVGTGLGLAICQRIVRSLDGEISVNSTLGQGSAFRVVLPPAGGATAERATITPPAPSPTVGRRRILVVDDDPLVLRVTRRTLSGDHDVEVTDHARAAADLIAAGNLYDLILCDLQMPQMTGMDLYEALASDAPDQAERMVFFTGGAFTEGARAHLDRHPGRKIDKPFDRLTLLRTVNDFLERFEKRRDP